MHHITLHLTGLWRDLCRCLRGQRSWREGNIPVTLVTVQSSPERGRISWNSAEASGHAAYVACLQLYWPRSDLSGFNGKSIWLVFKSWVQISAGFRIFFSHSLNTTASVKLSLVVLHHTLYWLLAGLQVSCLLYIHYVHIWICSDPVVDGRQVKYSLVPRLHPLTRRDGLVYQVNYLGLVDTLATV